MAPQLIVPTVIAGVPVNPPAFVALVAVAALPANVEPLVIPVIPEYATLDAVAALPANVEPLVIPVIPEYATLDAVAALPENCAPYTVVNLILEVPNVYVASADGAIVPAAVIAPQLNVPTPETF
jgi:hypothetical protein